MSAVSSSHPNKPFLSVASSPVILPCMIITLSIPVILFLVSKRYKNRKIYLLDFSCYKPSSAAVVQSCTRQTVMQRSRMSGSHSEDNARFMEKILERSGLGEATHLPAALLNLPPQPSLAEARREAEEVMFGAVDDLLGKTSGVISRRREEIGIVVVNCSAFSVAPSLSSMIVNRYGLGEKVLTYNLAGMGCSAGLAAIGLAKHLLQAPPSFCNCA